MVQGINQEWKVATKKNKYSGFQPCRLKKNNNKKLKKNLKSIMWSMYQKHDNKSCMHVLTSGIYKKSTDTSCSHNA